MKLSKIVQLLDGKVLTDQINQEKDVAGAMGADLMSDVLASIQPEAALLTGLCNPQVVRTALIADIQAIVFVRGKQPARETIQLANDEKIPLISTDRGLFEACGILFKSGLPCYESPTNDDCAEG